MSLQAEPVLSERQLLAQPASAYMNEAQQAFFRDLLLRQRAELQARIDGEFDALREVERPGDEADVASREEQRQWQLRLLEREKKLTPEAMADVIAYTQGEYATSLLKGRADEPGQKKMIERVTEMTAT